MKPLVIYAPRYESAHLREQAERSLPDARVSRADLSSRRRVRLAVREARRVLAYLRAAAERDARIYDDAPCTFCGESQHHAEGCPLSYATDGLHYEAGELFRVHCGRPEPL